MKLKIYISIILFALSFCFFKITPLFAEVSPERLIIPLVEELGVEIFMQSKYRAAYWPLSQYYEAQEKNHCGIASAVMVLNALHVPRPQLWAGSPSNLFTQDNFFSSDVKKLIDRNNVKTSGVSLTDLALTIKTWGANVKIVWGNTLSLDTFREFLKISLVETDRFIIANYNRTLLHQLGGGHISPIAAYDQETDNILILDVYRCRYTGTWVKLPEFLKAMQASNDSCVVRGMLLVQRPD